jgi:hypothetical protein
MKVRALVVLALSLVASMPLMAQTCSSTAYTSTLICTVPQLFGPQGMALNNPNHNAHFAAASEVQFRPLNQAIGQELSILPLGSAGAGTTFKLDSEGHPVPTEDSLGPILTERANVIGKKAFTLGVAWQYFSFDKIDGINLHSFPAALLHEGSTDLNAIGPLAYKNDYITTQNAAHLDLNQTVIYAVFGLTNRMDVSIELPIQAAHFQVSSSAHIVRTQPCEKTQDTNSATANYQGGDCFGTSPVYGPLDAENAGVCGEFHYFQGNAGDCATVFQSVDAVYPFPGAPGLLGEVPNTTPGPTRSGPPGTDATGIGDITLRGKYEVIRGEKFVGSIGLGVRFPSGDAKTFLGTGAYGVTPFGALTYASKLSPHVRFGYEWNSHSVLSGDPTGLAGAPSTASLPAAWLYSGGVDYRAAKRLTLAADLIGQRVLSASRLSLGSYPRLPETDGNTDPRTESLIAVPSIKPVTSGYSSDAVAVGGKIRLWGELILVGNATIRVDDGGLRANVVPLVGLSWSK